jgi:putative endonuclease
MSCITYILFSPSSGRYYIGSTDNLEKRLERHNKGATRSTKPYRPWEIAHVDIFDTKTEARKREKQIKAYKHGEAFKKLLRSNPALGGTPPSKKYFN